MKIDERNEIEVYNRDGSSREGHPIELVWELWVPKGLGIFFQLRVLEALNTYLRKDLIKMTIMGVQFGDMTDAVSISLPWKARVTMVLKENDL